MLSEEVLDLRRTTRAEKIEQIKQAAFLFARMTRDAEEIAAALRVSPRTVQRMIHHPLFQAEVKRHGYQGEMRFRKAQRAPRGAERMQKPEYQQVKRLWAEMSHIPEYGRAKAIADRPDVTVSYDTIRRWIRDWKEK